MASESTSKTLAQCIAMEGKEFMTLQEQGQQADAYRQKILLLDDHHLVLDALTFMFKGAYEVRTADTLKDFETGVDEFKPDLAIIDVHFPEGDGLETARRVLAQKPDLKVLFLSMHTQPRFVRQAFEIGARGYVSKTASADELMAGIEIILDGGTYVSPGLQTALEEESAGEPVLTERQKEVLRLISQGCSAKEIASQLNISVRTAEFHRAAIMERLNLHSTAMMTRYAVERGLA